MAVRYDPMPAFRYAHARDGRPLHESGNRNCPLCKVNGCYSYNEFSRYVGFNGTAMAQWLKRGGMNEQTADRVASELGLHPSYLWPEWWTNLEVIEQYAAERAERIREQDKASKERVKARAQAEAEAMFEQARAS